MYFSPSHLQDVDEEREAVVLDEVAAGGRGLVRQVPQSAQRELQGGVHHALPGLLLHDVQELLREREPEREREREKERERESEREGDSEVDESVFCRPHCTP